MFARAPVAVPAGADFVVEGTVYFVLFGAEDGGEEVGHFDGWGVSWGGIGGLFCWMVEVERCEVGRLNVFGGDFVTRCAWLCYCYRVVSDYYYFIQMTKNV